MVQGQLVSHLEKDKIKSILHHHTQELNSKWIINLNVKKKNRGKESHTNIRRKHI